MPVQSDKTDSQEPRRFSWPMRIFLGSYLFYMVFSCLTTSLIDARGWADDYGVARSPLGLPASAELSLIDAGDHPDGWTKASDRVWASMESLGRFLVPGLSSEPLHDVDSVSDGLRASVGWLETRMLFLGELVGIGQRWEMFSPGVFTEYSIPRFELFYDDGSSHTLRAECDAPEDLLQARYPFWFNHKRLRICYYFLQYDEVRDGTLSHLALTHSTSDSGADLSYIEVRSASYDFLPIGEDPESWYQAQSGPPESQISDALLRYDVATRQLISLGEMP
jgi:hypothetical protein